MNFFLKLFQPKTSNPDKCTKESTDPTESKESVENNSDLNADSTISHYSVSPGAESISQVTLDYRGRAKLHGQ